jgi:hypothetical protein
MSILRLPFARLPKLAAIVFLLAASVAPLAAKFNWEPIPAADLKGTECTWYPGADAEALLMRVVLEGSRGGYFTGLYYKRIKIYSPKGVEDMGVLSLERSSDQRVWDHAARVTKPDGTSKEYGKEFFHETVEAKLGSAKINRLKLAVPDLSAGDIVEIKWKIELNSSYYWWYAQLDVPVRLYTFETDDLGFPYSTNWFNAKAEGKPKKNGEGLDLVMTHLPPFKAEPSMPPERDVRGWFMIYFNYVFRDTPKDGDVLKDISDTSAREFRDRTKPDGTVKAKAAELIAGATTDDEKLRRLYEFVQRHVENFDYVNSVSLQAARKKLGDDQTQSPKNTLARGTGSSAHINDLFASLARAAGFEVAGSYAASRYSTLTVRETNGWLFLSDQLVAVKVAGKWRCFAPGDYLVPYGLLDVSNLGVSVLLCQKDKVEWIETPVPRAAESLVERHAKVAIDVDGTLEGDVEIVTNGYAAVSEKRGARGKQQEEIDADFRKAITDVMPGAEISDLVWENLTGLEFPLKVRYKVKVPGYAEAVGTRLVVPLDYFTHNQPAKFVADNRQFPIVFWYPYMERDIIQLTVPEGFRADAPSAPENVKGSGGIGSTYRVGYRRVARRVDYQRELVVCEEGAIGFQTNSYPALKRRFDLIKKSDAHTIVFAETAPAESKPEQPGTGVTH